ncbi:hypothetical protein Agub_g15667 [Astrephomene gubernaculifera]|uniref:Uncharacterized protein n=1 Tax=Astrephomene gubernaculifera TaxID=47775 RepID=A0AAD3E3X4_9CHLO|nr:hypothetical protein Agub_g15667 [Astrephomene gubernaculifera]
MDVRRWRKGFFLALISLLLSNSPSANSSTCSIQLVGNSTTGALLGSAQGVADCQCWEEYGYGRGAIIEYPYLNSELSDLCDMAGFPGGLFGYSDNSNDAVAVRPWWRSAQPNATTLKFSGSLITLDGEGSQVPTAANLDLTANGPFMPLLYFSRVTNLTLRNLVFRNLTASGPLILLEGCSNVTLQNVTFEDVRFVAGSSTAGLIRAVRLSYSDASSAAAATTAAGAGPDAPLSDVVMRGITARRISVASSGRSTTTTTTSNSAHVTLSGCSNGCALEHMAFEDMELDASWAAALAVSDLSSASLSNVRLSKITSAGSSCGISISNTSNVRAANTTAKGFSSGSNNLQASALCARQSVDLVLNGYSCSGCSSRQGPCLNTALSSISLSGGNFTGNTATVGGSGGALCLLGNVAGSSAALQLSNCTFAVNTAGSGGAIAVVPSNGASLSLDISSSTFVKNTAYMYGTEPAFGGDIYSVDDSSLVVSSSSFVGSTAADGGSNGGSIYARRSRAAVSGSNFTGCTSLNRGGAIYHEPVAKYCPSPDSCSLSLDACRFENNSADEGGAVVFLLLENTISGFNVSSSTFLSNSAGNVGGAISMPGNCEPYVNDACKVQADPKRQALSRLRSCRFEGNSALTGGAVYYAYNNAQGLSITSTEFVGNSAKEHGGLHIRAVPAVEISDTLFANNTATLIGAASLYSLHSHALINNATFRNNSCNQGESGTGSALYVAEYDGVTSNGTQDGEVFTLTLSNSTFEDNFSSSESGGASITRCNALLEDVSFRNNAAARKGGALYLEPDVGGVLVAAMDSVKRRVTDATLRRVRFRDNRATTNAGALLVSGWRLQMEDVSFVNNSANTFAAGGSDNAGGAMMATNCPATLELRNVSFSQNRAYQGGALIAEVCNMTLRNANFSSNTARGDAGAVLVTGFTSKDFTADSSPYALNLVDTAFEKNIASGVGGALKAYWAVVSAAGTVFNNNKASIQGGAVYLQIVPPMPHTDNGAAVDTGVRAVFDRCEFLSNAVNNSGGALFHAASAVHLSDCKLYDNSAGNGFISDSWSNAGGAIFGMSCTAPMRLAGGELSGNRADGRGGAVALLSCAASLEGSDMYGNIAKLSGGGVSAGHQVTSAQPEGPELSITNCTLRSNTAADEHGGSVHTTSVPLSLRGSRLAASTAKQMGGAVFSSAAASVTMSNCTLEGNRAGLSGGGLRAEGCGLVMVDGLIVKDNGADNSGGGLGLLNANCTRLHGLRLLNNSADYGAGMHVTMPALTQHIPTAAGLPCVTAFSKQLGKGWNGQLTRGSQDILAVQGTSFGLVASDVSAHGNSAHGAEGGALLLEATRGSVLIDTLNASGNFAGTDGAALALYSTRADDNMFYLSSSQLYDNEAVGIGGAIAMDGSWAHQQMFISNTTFQRNRAASGGAVSLTRNASLALQDCTLEDNTAAGSSAGDSGDGSGGSLYGESCNWMMLKDTTIRTSSAVRGHGGGLYCSGCGGVVLHNASLVLNDAAGSGGAAYVDASTATGPSLVAVLGGNMSFNAAGSNGSSTAVASDGNLLSGSGGALYLGGRLAAVLNGSRLVGNTAARAAGALALDLRCEQDTSGGSGLVPSSPRLFPLLGRSSIATSSSSSPATSLAVSMSSLRPGLAEIAAESALTLQALAGAVGRSAASDCWPAVANRPGLWNNTAGESGGGIFSSSPYTLTLLCDDGDSSTACFLDTELADMLNAILQSSTGNSTGAASSMTPPSFSPVTAAQLFVPSPPSSSSAFGSSNSSSSGSSGSVLYLGMLPSLERVQGQCLTQQESYAAVSPNTAVAGYGNQVATTPKQMILSALSEYEQGALTSYTSNIVGTGSSSNSSNTPDKASGVNRRLLTVQTVIPSSGTGPTVDSSSGNAVAMPSGTLDIAELTSGSNSSSMAGWLRRAVLQVDGHLAEECRPGQRCAVVLPTNVAVALDISVYDALTQLVNDSSTVQPVVRLSVNSTSSGHPIDLLGNPTAQAGQGIASISGIRVRALKGNYTMQLDLSSTVGLQVDPLVLDVTVPPCSLGEAVMDKGYFCSRCATNFFSLDVDNLTNTGTTAVREGSCYACPDNANCTGGAVLAPLPGYWHSAANSTTMQACLNPAACRDGDDAANDALVRCQERWYAYFGNPWRFQALQKDPSGGAGVVGSYLDILRRITANATSVQPYTPLISNSSSDFDGFLLDCALWGLPDNDSASYMQMQCAPGYSGLLCGTCTKYDGVPYALDSDLNCGLCYSTGGTVAIGIVMFLFNTLSIGFAFVTTAMEDFQQDKQQDASSSYKPGTKEDIAGGHTDNGGHARTPEETAGDANKAGEAGKAAGEAGKVAVKADEAQETQGPGEPEEAGKAEEAGEAKEAGEAERAAEAGEVGEAAEDCKAGEVEEAVEAGEAEGAGEPMKAGEAAEAGEAEEAGGAAEGAGEAQGDGKGTESHQKAKRGFDVPAADVLKLLIVHFQLYLIVTRIGLNWPASVMGLQKVLGTITGIVKQVYSPSCLRPNADSAEQARVQLLSGLLLPFFSVLLVLVLWFLLRRYFNSSKRATAAAGAEPLGLANTNTGSTGSPAGQQGEKPPVGTVEGNECINDADEDAAISSPRTRRSKGGALLVNKQQSFPADRFVGGRRTTLRSLTSVPTSTAHIVVHFQQAQQPEMVDNPLANHPPSGSSAGADGKNEQSGLEEVKGSLRRGQEDEPDCIELCECLSPRRIKSELFDNPKLPLEKQMFLALMVGCFMLMPDWATEALSIFACYRLDDGQVDDNVSSNYAQFQLATWKYGYWIRDMNQQCYTGRHLTLWVPIGVVAVVVMCLAMPLTTAMLLYMHRGRWDEPQVAQLYGFLFNSYRKEFYFWEAVSQLQTLSLVVAEVFGRVLPVLQQALLLEVMLLVFLIVNTYLSPLEEEALNSLQLVSTGVICLTVLLGMFTSSSGIEISKATQTGLAFLVLFINCVVIAAFVALFVYNFIPIAKKLARRCKEWLEKHGWVSKCLLPADSNGGLDARGQRRLFPLCCVNRTGSTVTADQGSDELGSAKNRNGSADGENRNGSGPQGDKGRDGGCFGSGQRSKRYVAGVGQNGPDAV